MPEDLLFVIQDVFEITGRGTVLSGEVCRGSVGIGDEVVVVSPGGGLEHTRVVGVEHAGKLVDGATAGESRVGLLIERLRRADVAAGSSVRSARAESNVAPMVATAATWAADPAGRHELRYWDGLAWTAHVSDAGAVSQDPLEPGSQPGSAVVGRAGAGVEPDLEALRARVRTQLAQYGPALFERLNLDIHPLALPERLVLLGQQLERADKQGQVLGLLEQRAAIYQVLGMTTEEDRDRLAWAAIKEGHSGLSRTSKFWARGVLGLEYGSTFVATYDLLTKREGEKVRVPLMRAGRAVALGYCSRCGRVERLDERMRCPRGHADVEDPACVVPPDEPQTRTALQAAHGGMSPDR
jgi:hypothetical protein